MTIIAATQPTLLETARARRIAALEAVKAKRATSNVVAFDRDALLEARRQKETPVFTSRRTEFQEDFPFVRAA
ncbi:MAG: hypothetical protein AAGD04_02825 [Pseudomonadota bacterium]